jgi:Flp pilus assembly protein TadB
MLDLKADPCFLSDECFISTFQAACIREVDHQLISLFLQYTSKINEVFEENTENVIQTFCSSKSLNFDSLKLMIGIYLFILFYFIFLFLLFYFFIFWLFILLFHFFVFILVSIFICFIYCFYCKKKKKQI